MNSTELEVKAVPQSARCPKQIFFKDGLTPFIKARTYRLFIEADAPPFLRMECIDTDLAFVLVDPYALIPDYRPEFSDADVSSVGLKGMDKPLILAIVNFSRGVREATVNLAGPLLINPWTGNGKQVVLVNANQYFVRQPLKQE